MVALSWRSFAIASSEWMADEVVKEFDRLAPCKPRPLGRERLHIGRGRDGREMSFVESWEIGDVRSERS